MTPDLIERLEAAGWPDRELDTEIARLQNAVVLRRKWDDSGNEEFTHWHYTASIDAALTLVPEGCLLVLKTLWDGDNTAGYAIIQHYAPTETCGRRYDGETTAIAATPALALCIAALKARTVERD